MKTSDLIGPALDRAVAVAMKVTIVYTSPVVVQRDIRNTLPFEPSTDWSQGGPVIEREKIGTWPSEKEGHEDQWGARMLNTHITYGPTPLVAAMRCYVASKLGDNVDVPKELT